MMRKITREIQIAMNVAQTFSERYQAAAKAKKAIENLRKELDGDLISPDIDKVLQAAIVMAMKICRESTPGKAEEFYFENKNLLA